MKKNIEKFNSSKDFLDFLSAIKKELYFLKETIENFSKDIPKDLTTEIKKKVDDFEKQIGQLDISKQREKFDEFVESLKDILNNPEYKEYKETIDRLFDKVKELEEKVIRYFKQQLNQLSQEVPTDPEKIKELANKGREDAGDKVKSLAKEATNDPNFNPPWWSLVSKHIV